MPELPEVETIRLEMLRCDLLGKPFGDTFIGWEKSIASPEAHLFANALKNRVLQSIQRIGKSLLFILDEGALSIHLRMSGKLLLAPFTPHLSPYLRIGFRIGQRELCLIDPRKFARVQLQKNLSDLRFSKGLDLLAFPQCQRSDQERVVERLLRGSRAVKAALLDQDIVSGIGNIYADETLWRARLDPTMRVCDLFPSQAIDLLMHAVNIAKAAITAGGTSLGTSQMNFQSALGKPGLYQKELAVYGRLGLPCLRCRTLITKKQIAQRTSHFCPSCQSPAS